MTSEAVLALVESGRSAGFPSTVLVGGEDGWREFARAASEADLTDVFVKLRLHRERLERERAAERSDAHARGEFATDPEGQRQLAEADVRDYADWEARRPQRIEKLLERIAGALEKR